MNRPMRRRGLAASIVASCLLLTAACSGDGNEPETLPSKPSSSEASSPATSQSTEPPAPTANPRTDREKATADAKQAVREFKTFTDKLGADPKLGLEGLSRYLQDPELTAQLDFRQRFRKRGFYTDGGHTTFDWLRVTDVQVFKKKRKAQVGITACYNLDDVQAFYRNGKPVDALTPGLAYYQVFNYDYPSSAGWKIAVEDIPGKRCKA